LSKEFLDVPYAVIDLTGVNFFDRLLFTIRFQYTQSFKLIDDHVMMLKNKGNLDCISMLTGDKKSLIEVLHSYLDKTKDILSIGLASFILNEFYQWSEFEQFQNLLIEVLGKANFNFVQNIHKEQLSLRKEIRKISPNSDKIQKSVAYVCYHCYKEPGKYSRTEGDKSNCELIR